MTATKIPTDKTMLEGRCIDAMQVFFVEDLDYAVKNDAQISFTSIYQPRVNSLEPWAGKAYPDHRLTSCCLFPVRDGCLRSVLTQEGFVRLYGPGGKPDRSFQIPEAGVFREGAAGYGYVSRIRSIGAGLYVCGVSRQVYRYVVDPRGEPLSGFFADIAGPMRQPPLEPPPAPSGPAFDAWVARDIVLFNDIAGSSEQDIYATGDETWHFDGFDWRQLDLGNDGASMHVIKVLDAERVLIGGANGFLHVGNARTGFKSLVGVADNATITGLEWFDGQIFVATDKGLCTLDRAARRLVPFATGLQPELQDCHLLEAKDGVLWSFGYKDLAYCDARAGGQEWVRVHHPDNPRIGAPARAQSSRRSNQQAAADDRTWFTTDAAVAFEQWLPARGDAPVDLAGFIRRVGHKGIGAWICAQLSPFGCEPEALLQFARTHRYDVPLPRLGLSLELQYIGRKKALADPRANPQLWALSAIELQSAAAQAGQAGWLGSWPGALEPLQANWRAQANAVWGEPGYRSADAQTHFVPGANGTALAVKLIHHQGPALERVRIESMGEYVG